MAKPEIRLKGFEGEWEVVKLSSIANRITRKNSHLESTLPLTISAAKGLIEQTSFFNNVVASSNVSGYYLVKNGEFAYNKSYSSGYPFGAVKRLDRYEKGVLSTLYIVFSIDEKVSSDYIVQFFETSLWHQEVAKRAAEGARNHGLLNIGADDFLDIDINLPKRKVEQQQIASFFTCLDKQISLQEQRLEKLKQMKSACLVSMFPQAGETTPRVRFKGFEGEWMKECAGHLFITFNERNRPDLPVLSANQDIRGMAPRNDIGYQISHNRSNEVTYKVVQPGQFIIHLRSFQGGFAHSSVEGITSPAYTVFGFKNSCEHDDYFWKIIFMSKEFIKRLETITYGIRDGKSISFAEFSEMKFLFPSKEEQQCIASYFRSLDKQISLQEQRLEKLKQIKAACLDKMFV